jgi:soluble lytic murein transglycosylase
MLILAVIDVESGFRLTAVSHQGARGLMQIRPIVVHELAPLLDPEAGANSDLLQHIDLDDPASNIRLGAFYLTRLKKSFSDLNAALAAYNWGPTRIRAQMADSEPIPQEYPAKVLAAYGRYKAAYNYN